MFLPESIRLLQFSRRPGRFHDRKDKHNLKPDKFGFVVLETNVFMRFCHDHSSRRQSKIHMGAKPFEHDFKVRATL